LKILLEPDLEKNSTKRKEDKKRSFFLLNSYRPWVLDGEGLRSLLHTMGGRLNSGFEKETTGHYKFLWQGGTYRERHQDINFAVYRGESEKKGLVWLQKLEERSLLEKAGGVHRLQTIPVVEDRDRLVHENSAGLTPSSTEEKAQGGTPNS